LSQFERFVRVFAYQDAPLVKMSTTYTCTQCLRALKGVARPNKVLRLDSSIPRTQPQQPSFVRSQVPISSRAFSSRSRQPQEVVAKNDPIGNVSTTAPTPSPIPSGNEPSTAEMQRQIASRMGRSDLGTTLAQKLRSGPLRRTADTYITYGLSEALFKTCSLEADYSIPEDQRQGLLTGTGPVKTASGEDLGQPEGDSWWHREMRLEPTFSTWSQVTYLHMYLLTVRLRGLDDQTSFQNYQRYLLEHFSHAAEDKMLIFHGMAARGIRNKYLKDLFLQWRGLMAAYDEGLVKGDAELAGAVWRNLFKGSEEVDWVKVAEVVAYIRRSIQLLGEKELSDINDAISEKGKLFTTARQDVKRLVEQTSAGMTKPITV
jgi:cytochrome b pre-mRNA-processing protein 3